jgi:ubiquitin-associated and SH3 domain-containing protein
MPKILPKRDNPNDYDFDTPLTEIGLLQAKLSGEELAKNGIKIKHMYSSPALRSIQTADKILEGMGLKNTVPIKIETGLFELLSWQAYVPSRNPFIDASSLVKAGKVLHLS